MEILSGKTSPPWSIMIYGVSGIGKSSVAALAPKPIFLNLEDGLSRIDCERSPHIKTFEMFSKNLGFCSTSKYKTVVIDTASALEDLLVDVILAEKNQTLTNQKVDLLTDKKHFPYGEGGTILRAKWAFVMSMIDRLKELGKNVILVAHEALYSVVNPDGEDYQRVSPNIHKKAIDLVAARLDGIFQLHYERLNRTKVNSITKATFMTDTGERHLLCEERASALAKNRFGLPRTLSVSKTEEVIDFYDKL